MAPTTSSSSSSTRRVISKPAPTQYDQPRANFLNSRNGWIAMWLFRVAQAVFIVQGADVPDEWWQSTEVAEYVVFGRGALTWEWGQEALRSYIYPLPFIVVFWILKITSLDSFPFLLWFLPRVMAASTCFAIDVLIAKVARKNLFPSERAFTLSLVLSLSSWFLGFVGVRTQSNVAEALAFMFALNSRTFIGFLICCGLGCAFRVTFAIPAMILFYHRIQDRCLSFDLYNEIDAAKKRRIAIQESNYNLETGDSDEEYDEEKEAENSTLYKLDSRLCPFRKPSSGISVATSLAQHVGSSAVIVALTVVGMSLIDSIFYGRLTCSPLNFLIFNVVSGLSKLFGTHPIHWYVTSALPVMFLTLIPIAGLGYKAIMTANPPIAYAHRPGAGALSIVSRKFVIRMFQIIVFSTCLMSLLGHKEMRFLYFTVPCMILIATAAFSIDPYLWRKRKIITSAVVLVNLIVLVFFGLFWQRAPISVASYLRSSEGCDARYSVHALTHCFSMPGESFFHGCVKNFVHNTCPVVQIKNLAPEDWRRQHLDAISEQGAHERFKVVLPTKNDMFLESPLVFVEYVYEGKIPTSNLFKIRVDAAFDEGNNNNEKTKRHLPMKFVLYDVHEELLAPFFQRNGYARTRSFFHTWIPLEDFHGKTMVLYEKKF